MKLPHLSQCSSALSHARVAVRSGAPILGALVIALASSACASSGEGTGENSDALGSTWAGKTYLMQVPTTHWSTPRGVGDDIGPYVPVFLLRVDAAEGNNVTVTVGTANPDGTQDTCGATTTFTGTGTAFPSVVIGPTDLPVYLRNTPKMVAANATIRSISFENLLPDGVTPPDDDDGLIRATMDFREAYPLLTLLPDPTPDSACAALQEGLGVPCEACPHDGGPYCLSLIADGLGAVEYMGVPMVDVAPGGCMNMSPPAATP